MKKWEDIVKDKLEGYESPLPEGSLAEFRARRDGVAPARKRRLPVWPMAAATAVAAGLAAALLLRQPTVPEDGIQLVPQSAAPVAMDLDSADTIDPIPDIPLVAQAVTPRVVRHSAPLPQEAVEDVVPAEEAPIVPADVAESQETEETTVSEPTDKVPADEIDTNRWTESPFIPQVPVKKRMSLKVAPAAGLVAGGSLLASVITPFVKNGTYPVVTSTYTHSNKPTDSILNNGNAISSWVYPDYPNYFNAADPENPLKPEEVDALSGEYSHYRPFKTGLSARIPLTEKWSLTTGLEYTLYSSQFTYSLSGKKTQLAHYLGVPVRLDYTLASNRWLEAYVGGGVAGDLCVRATLNEKALRKDGFCLSLLGACGLQWNMTERLGLFVEPQLSWTSPSKTPVLATYRTDHPFVFTVATGIRINVKK